MQSLYHRQFDVDYFEMDDGSWKATTHLVDDMHDITVEVAVTVPDLTIRDLTVRFDRVPMNECLVFITKCAQLKGTEIRKDFGQKVARLFLGAEGCSNVYVMLTLALPAMAHFYYPFEQERRAGIAHVDRAGDECIAHTLYNQKRRQDAGGSDANQSAMRPSSRVVSERENGGM